MNTCKTCKFWSRIYVHHVRDRITGEVFETFKPGTHDPLRWEEFNEEWDRGKCTGLEDRTDFVSGRGGYPETGPDFGCVHHEAK